MPEAGLQSSPTEGVIHVASSVDNPAMSPHTHNTARHQSNWIILQWKGIEYNNNTAK